MSAPISAESLSRMEAAALRGTPLAAGHVLDLIHELRERRSDLETYNAKLREIRARWGIDVLAGGVDRLAEHVEIVERELGLLRYKTGTGG